MDYKLWKISVEERMKVGDLVRCNRGGDELGLWVEGLVVGFALKGEGGRDFVHILVDGEVEVFMSFNIEVIKNDVD